MIFMHLVLCAHKHQVGNLKEKLSQKETEFVDLQKTLKTKEQEILEEKYKVDSLDKWVRNAKKSVRSIT